MKIKIKEPVERLLFSLHDTRQILGAISMGTLYNLRARRELRIVKVGRRSFVEKKEIDRFLARLSEAEKLGTKDPSVDPHGSED